MTKTKEEVYNLANDYVDDMIKSASKIGIHIGSYGQDCFHKGFVDGYNKAMEAYAQQSPVPTPQNEAKNGSEPGQK